jgi:hypothetical protein
MINFLRLATFYKSCEKIKIATITFFAYLSKAMHFISMYNFLITYLGKHNFFQDLL